MTALFRKLLLLLPVAAIAAGAYFLAASFTDLGRFADALGQIGNHVLIAVLGLSIVNYALRYWRWRFLLKALGRDVPEGPHIACYMAGFAFTATPGKAGEAVRTLYLLPHGVKASESIGVFIVERLLDLAVIVLLAVLLFTGWPVSVLATAVTLGAAGAVRGLWMHDGVRAFWRGIFSRMPASLRRAADRVGTFTEVGGRLASPGLLRIGLVTGLVAWFAEGYGLFLLATSLASQVEVAPIVGAYAMSVLVGVISFLPGGLGSTEAAMTLLLTHQGLSVEGALAATIVCRVATLWFAVVLGLVAAGWLAIFGRTSERVQTP